MSGAKRFNGSSVTKPGSAIPDIPDRPTIGTATNSPSGRAFNNGAATVTFTASATGGAPSSVVATSSPGGFTGSSATSPITVTGLQSNTAYTFTIASTNSTGTSPSISASNSITATTTPQAPTIGTATNVANQNYTGNASVTVAFTASANNGGSAITGYTATSSSGATNTGASSPITITESTLGTPRTYTVTANNANGISSDSPNLFANSLDIFAFVGTVGHNNCTASRDAAAGPSPAGGTPLKMTFTGTATDPHFNMYNSPSFNIGPTVYNQPITVSVYVKGNKNMTGQLFIFGADSTGNAFSGGTYAAGSISITTSWTRVSFTYTPTGIVTRFVQVRLDGPDSGGVAGDAIWWDGLQVEYGSSASTFNSTQRLSTSNVVVPSTKPQTPTIGTPTVANGQAYTGNASVSVPFTAGANGGSSVTSFTVTSSSGNTASGSASPISISDAVGVARTYTVTATNANGASAASSASASTTPSSVPQAPTIGTASISGTTASITFTANNNGGSAVTSYTATSSPGGIQGSGGSPISISGLSAGTSYTFTVTATNARGTSAASAASNSVQAGQSFRYFILDVTNTKGGGNSVQLSEFNIMNGGTRITGGTYMNWNNSFSGNSSSNSNGDSPGGEGPSLANDGSTGTKWLDFRRLDGGLWIDFGSAQSCTGYQWYTANDSTERDMTSWIVYGSNNNSSWTTLSTITNASITNNRNSFAGSWNF